MSESGDSMELSTTRRRPAEAARPQVAVKTPDGAEASAEEVPVDTI